MPTTLIVYLAERYVVYMCVTLYKYEKYSLVMTEKMKKNLRRFSIYMLVASFASLISACGGMKNYRSVPTIETVESYEKVFEPKIGELFVFNDISFSVQPRNSSDSRINVWPIPFVVIHDPKKDLQIPFNVGIVLYTARSGALFNPSEVYYWGDSTEKHMPKRIKGPDECGSIYPHSWKELPIQLIVLFEKSYTCIVLEFDTLTPNPSKTFYVEILGLSFDGVKRPLPVIQFKESIYYSPINLANNKLIEIGLLLIPPVAAADSGENHRENSTAPRE